MNDESEFAETQSSSQSEFIVYVDESGDHGMVGFDPNYPVFVLAFCVFRKQDYVTSITPAIQSLKFKHFGHDMVILHERDIRKCKPPFEFLLNPARRQSFLEDLNEIMTDADFSLIVAVIDKRECVSGIIPANYNPYHVAMESCLKRLDGFLRRRGNDGVTHVVFEQRGRAEDRDVELEFRRVVSANAMRCEIVMADKKVNSCGLQLADLVARPIGRRFLDDLSKSNRAFDILKQKMRIDGDGAESAECYVEVFP